MVLKKFLFKRGTSKQIEKYQLDEGEIVINTQTKSIHVGDGENSVGFEVPSKTGVENIVKDAVSISKDVEDLENGSYAVNPTSNIITEEPDVSILALQQDIWGYKNTVDYTIGTYVMYQGDIYKCIQVNGASSTVVAPDSVSPLGSDYWKDIENQDSTSLIPNQLIVSPVPLTDANLHLLDGALLSGSGAYTGYVAIMGELYNADPTANIWTDEATWQASVTSTGSCGKFVYDSVNNTLRLPKYDARYLKSTLSASDLGDLVNAQAPNVKGSFLGAFSVSSGCFSHESAAYTISASPVSHSSSTKILDASRSSSVYSDSATTIDTDAIKVYYYIVLGTVSKTQIQIDIDNVMSDLANKADKEFSNVTAPIQAFKDMSIGWGLPDWTTGVQITQFPYTATYKSWLVGITGLAGTSAQEVYINNHRVSREDGDNAGVQVPLDVGDVVSLSSGTATGLYVYAMKGV